jgi:nucleotide-binding universal stress UspA family protein
MAQPYEISRRFAMVDDTDSPHIVVGVDASPCSKRALRWAMTQARLSGATIEAITAWQAPARYGTVYGMVPVMFGDAGISEITGKVLDDTITAVAGQLDEPVEVRARVVQGHPAQVLLDAAADAQLLVVGGRGHSVLAGMRLGSVSHHCVQHAPCPVVVVPE